MSKLIDTNTVYCDVEDVEFWVKETTNSENIFYNDTKIKERIKENSEYIDRETKSAWRTRKETDKEIKINMTKDQEEALSHTLNTEYMRRRKRTMFDQYSKWVSLYLNRSHVESIQKIEYPQESQIYEIQNDEYRITSTKDSKIEIDLSVFRDIINSVKDNINPNFLDEYIVVEYEFGRGGIGDDVKKACAMMTAADIIRTDYYGSQITNDTEVDLSQVSEDLEERAENIIENYK